MASVTVAQSALEQPPRSGYSLFFRIVSCEQSSARVAKLFAKVDEERLLMMTILYLKVVQAAVSRFYEKQKVHNVFVGKGKPGNRVEKTRRLSKSPRCHRLDTG